MLIECPYKIYGTHINPYNINPQRTVSTIGSKIS